MSQINIECSEENKEAGDQISYHVLSWLKNKSFEDVKEIKIVLNEYLITISMIGNNRVLTSIIEPKIDTVPGLDRSLKKSFIYENIENELKNKLDALYKGLIGGNYEENNNNYIDNNNHGRV